MFSKKKYDFSQYSDDELQQVIKNNQETNNLLADLEDENDWHRRVRDTAISEASDELYDRRALRNRLGLSEE